MRAPRWSLRWRLAVAIALIAATLSAGIGVTVSTLTANDRLARARTAQAERAVFAADVMRSTRQMLDGAEFDAPRAPAALRRAVERGRVGTYVTAGDPATIWAGAPLRPDRELGWRRRTGARGFYVSAPFRRDDPAMQQLREALLLAGAIGTALAALVGVLLASGMSRRLRRAAVVADRVTAGDHSARIDAAGGDEIARLGHAVDQMSDALATRLAREQRFTGDVAHELRTPLTGLTSAAELLDHSRPAQIVRERVGALRSLVAELLELAQLDADEDGAAAPAPRPLALERWLREFGAAHPSAPALEFERPAVVLADRRRLERIVGNLLDNAMRHGRPPIVVRVTGALIEVRDDGPGLPAELLRDGPQRFWKGRADRAGGSGLGLAIAAGNAALVGAELRFANRPGGGAVAALGPLAVAAAPAYLPPVSWRSGAGVGEQLGGEDQSEQDDEPSQQVRGKPSGDGRTDAAPHEHPHAQRHDR